MPDYSKGKIYKLVKGDRVYIGSTVQRLCNRKAHHAHHYRKYISGESQLFYSSFFVYYLGTPDIVLIENYPCASKEELHKRERYYIENMECVNIALPGGFSESERKERKKIRDNLYYARNKDRIKERKRLKRIKTIENRKANEKYD
jgi:hypothetical protein